MCEWLVVGEDRVRSGIRPELPRANHSLVTSEEETQEFHLRYPLYQLGGPQLRVFRTNFFIQLVRPGTAQPEDTVQFRIPMEMTRVDLRNYLEQIYNVPVAAVRTRVQHGSNRRRDHKNVRIKKPDYKVAYVQLAHGQTFTFPDLFPEKEPSPADPLEEEPQQQRQSSDPRCPGIPSWFGL
ncbi:large ribosomal subunit protein uL23m isoform X1 [Alexandromys fortis]|uniref:large ribosomal subunit protein uL23m isoform X1 n=1 Tax=Alexandromys fortis TaxID=100897 RepID=UPI002152BFF8|nr:39S ribosomal protein L23, mitochondrial isoform X1 [Microtus fortis]